MGFTIANYTLLGIPLQNVYVTIKGRYWVQNDTFMNGIPNKYQINADYWLSVSKGQPTVQCSSIVVNLDVLPQNIYDLIYNNIKQNLDLNYGTSQSTLIFTDDI